MQNIRKIVTVAVNTAKTKTSFFLSISMIPLISVLSGIAREYEKVLTQLKTIA